MLFTIILSQILAVFCQQYDNFDIELQYEIGNSFENLKYRNVRPIPQDVPEEVEAPILVPDINFAVYNDYDYMNDDGRFANRRMNVINPSIGMPMEGHPIVIDSKNLIEVLEEMNEFRQELVEEAQKRIRGTGVQAVDIEQSGLDLRPRDIEPLNKFRRKNAVDETSNRVNFRKTKEIRGIIKYIANMNTNSGASALPLKRQKQNVKKIITLSPRDHERTVASDIYKFIETVGRARPKQKKGGALNLNITRNTSKIAQEEQRIISHILALSKKIDVLASERKQKSKQASLQSKKDSDFTLQRPDESKAKSLFDISKTIELITSQGGKHSLPQLSALSQELSEHVKTAAKLSEFKVSSEDLNNYNLTQREKLLELELQKIRSEIDLLTPKRDKILSPLQDVFSFIIKPTTMLSEPSDVYSDPTTVTATTSITETTKSIPTTTEHDTELDFHDIMNRRVTKISFLKSENISKPGFYRTRDDKPKVDKDLYNLDKNVTLSVSEESKLKEAETLIHLNVLDKRPDSVIEQVNKLLNLTLFHRLKETRRELPNIETMYPTTVSNFDLFHITKRRQSNRVKVLRRINKIHEKHKQQKERKHSIKKLPITKESDIDKFRKQLRMEYDSPE